MPPLKPIKVLTYGGKRYFSVTGASRVLRSSVKTVRKLMDQGILHRVQPEPNRRHVIPFENVIEVARARDEEKSRRDLLRKDKLPEYPKKVYRPIYREGIQRHREPTNPTPELFRLKKRTPR